MSEPIERTCITGVDPAGVFSTPWMRNDFQEAADLEEIGTALIANCPEFTDLKWATGREVDEDFDDGFPPIRIAYLWRKKASRSADRFKAGTLGKTGGKIKFLADAHYLVEIAADVNRFMTNWQMEALVYHELMHIKIARKALKRRDESEETKFVPDLKVRAHDLEMFFAEVERYGLWRSDLQKAQPTFAQAPLFGSDESVQESVVGRVTSVTLSSKDKSVTLTEPIDLTTRSGRNGLAPRVSNVTSDQAEALRRAGAANLGS